MKKKITASKNGADEKLPRLVMTRLDTLKVHLDGLCEVKAEDRLQLQRMIKFFGLLRPPFVLNQRTGNLLDGDNFIEPLRNEGVEEVPVWVIDIPQEAEEIAHLALKNRMGDWKWFNVSEVLKRIKAAGGDTALTGFPDWVVTPMLGANWRPGVLGAPGAEDPNQVKLI